MIDGVRRRGQGGQIVPPLLVILLTTLVLGFMMLQVGLASDFKGRSQTAADAGALAGAVNVKEQIEAAWAAGYQLTPEQVQWGIACAQAATYAARNNATLSSCANEFFDIKVEVVGNDELDQIGDTAELDGRSAEGRARATPFGVGGAGAFPSIGLPAAGGIVGGPLLGAGSHLQKYADAAARFGLVVTSGRDGRVGPHHGTGNAIDVAGPGGLTPDNQRKMLAFARYAAQAWGSSLEELIYTPLGFGIKNGQQVAPYAEADHIDHVHLADVAGTPGGGAGPPLPGGFMGGAFALGGGLSVHLVRWDGKGTGLTGDIPQGLPPGSPDVMQKMYQVMLCESGGDLRATEPPGGIGGPYGHYGLFQFDPPTWASVGGTGDPRNASYDEQWKRAMLLYAQRGFQPWECASKLGYI